MWIRSGDIRGQSRKLSEIVKNFGRFFGPPKFLGAGLPKIVLSLSLLHHGTSTEKSFVRIRGGTGRDFRRIPDPGTRPLLPGRIRVVAGSGYHRLNGSSSPVLTATCLSYGSL